MVAELMLAVLVAQAPAPAQTVMRQVSVGPDELIAVHMAGSGVSSVSGSPATPIVIVPGLLGSAYGFRRVIPDLARTGPVYVIDPLGTGDSSSPEDADYSLAAQANRIGQVVRAIGVRRAIFACQSTGAAMCFRLAHADPSLVAGIVSINGGPTESVKTPGLSLALTFAPLISLFGGDGWARGKVEDGLKKHAFDPSWVTDEVVRGYTAHYRNGVKPVLKTLKRMSDAKEPAPLAPMLPFISTPIQLLIGEANRESGVKPEEFPILATLPALTVDTIARAGEMIQEERPDAVIEAIRVMMRFTTPPPRPVVGRPTVDMPERPEHPRRIHQGNEPPAG